MSAGFEILASGSVHTREQAKIDAARLTQKARNELKGAMSASQAWAQSFANSRKMKMAGEQVGEIAENMARNLDVATSGRFADRLEASQAFGANVASAAAAGVGGSSIEMFNNTLRTTQALREESGDRALNTDLIASSNSRANTYGDAAGSMDNQSFQAGLDYTQYIDHVKMSTTAKVLGFAAAAGATYFGGPQAGEAVLSLVAGENKMANGDFEGGFSSYGSAFTNGVSALKGYTTRGNTPYGQDIWASARRQGAGAVPQIATYDATGLQRKLRG